MVTKMVTLFLLPEKMLLSLVAVTLEPIALERQYGMAANRWCNWKSCRSHRWNAPRTIRGRNGRRLTSLITARKKPPQNSVPTRASIWRPQHDLKVTEVI